MLPFLTQNKGPERSCVSAGGKTSWTPKKSKAVGLLAGLAALLLFSNQQPAAAQATDLECSKCVDAGDVADEAVTGVKLAPNAVSNAKIGNGAVNAAKLAANAVTVAKIANNSISTPKLTTASVTRSKIAPNAVNAAKIANAAVTAAKIAPGAVNKFKIADRAVTAAKLSIANTVFIEDSGDAVVNCDALLDALASLTGPGVILLGPGVYDCQANSVLLTSGVSLIGVGRNFVTITGDIQDLAPQVGLQGDNVLLQGVTIINETASLLFRRAVQVGTGLVDTTNWRIHDVTARAAGDSARAFDMANVNCDGGRISDSVAITDSPVGVSDGLAFNCTAGLVTVTNLRAQATGPLSRGLVVGNFTSVQMRNSSFAGELVSISASGGGAKTVVSSELGGSVGGSINCVGNYNQSGAALTNGPSDSGGCMIPP